MVKTKFVSLAGIIPPTIENSYDGVIIWVGLTNEDSEVLSNPIASDNFAWGLVHAVQESCEGKATTAIVVWPREKLSKNSNSYAYLVRDISVGVIQSSQYDLGIRGIRLNLILCYEDQIKDLNRTLRYFHGKDGGFVAGCTFDLRNNSEEVVA